MINHDFYQSDYESLYNFSENIQLALVYLSPDFHIADLNSIVERVYGLKKKEILLKNFLDLFRQKGFQCPVNKASTDTEKFTSPIINDTRHLLGDGRAIDVRWQISRALSEEGQCEGYLLTGKLFESMDNHSKDKQIKTLRRIVAAIPGAVYSKDIDGLYMDCNEYVNKIAGFKGENDIIGKTDFDTAWENVAENLHHNDHNVIISAQTRVIEEFPTLADGKKTIMLSTKSPLLSNDGKIIGVIGTSVDITDLKKQQFIGETNADRVYFENGRSGTFLTKREIECVNWLAKGKTAAEIADLLKISRRTVEAHIENIKHKTNCYKQFQLGYVLGKYGALLV